jgi:hypothetical protein
VTLENNGQRAAVVGAVPQEMSAIRAKAIVTTTATLAMKAEMPLAACAEYGDEATRWRASRLNPPDPDLDDPATDVELTKPGQSSNMVTRSGFVSTTTIRCFAGKS